MNEGKKAKRQQTRFNKKMPSLSDEDEDEEEDSEQEEFKQEEENDSPSKSADISQESDIPSDEDGSGNQKTMGTVQSSKKADEKQPLLPN